MKDIDIIQNSGYGRLCNKGSRIGRKGSHYSGRYSRVGKASVKSQLIVKVKHVTPKLKRVTPKINTFIMRRNRLLLKVMTDKWKDYERTPKPTYYKLIVCSFF